PPECIIDLREVGELARHSHMVACSHQAPANSPREPVSTRESALPMPSAALIELAQIGQQTMHGGIQMRRLLGDAFAELFELTIHIECISLESDIVVSDLDMNRVTASDHHEDNRSAGLAPGELGDSGEWSGTGLLARLRGLLCDDEGSRALGPCGDRGSGASTGRADVDEAREGAAREVHRAHVRASEGGLIGG